MYQTLTTTTSDLGRTTAHLDSSDSKLVGGLTRGHGRDTEEVLCVKSMAICLLYLGSNMTEH